LKQLARISEMVISDPEIMRGTPVFKGTRIPVDLVADMLAQGATAEDILEGYPTLSKEKIAIAPLYMRAFPRRGRPSRHPWQRKKARGRKSYPLSAFLKSAFMAQTTASTVSRPSCCNAAIRLWPSITT